VEALSPIFVHDYGAMRARSTRTTRDRWHDVSQHIAVARWPRENHTELILGTHRGALFEVTAAVGGPHI